MNQPHGPDRPRTHNGARRRLYSQRSLRRNILHAARAATATPQNVQRAKQGVGPGRSMLRHTVVSLVKEGRIKVERVHKTRDHRKDGSPATLPSISDRRHHRRHVGKIAKASRKANR